MYFCREVFYQHYKIIKYKFLSLESDIINKVNLKKRPYLYPFQ